MMDQPFMIISPLPIYGEGSADLAGDSLAALSQGTSAAKPFFHFLASRAISGPGKSRETLWGNALPARGAQAVCLVPQPLQSIRNQSCQVPFPKERKDFSHCCGKRGSDFVGARHLFLSDVFR